MHNYEHQKATILNSLKASRQGMRVINHCASTFPELKDTCLSIVAAEQSNIKTLFNELIQLERKKNGKN